MHRLLAESFALGAKTVLVGAYLLDLVRRRELVDLSSSFALVDMAKRAWLRETESVLRLVEEELASPDPLAPTADRRDWN